MAGFIRQPAAVGLYRAVSWPLIWAGIARLGRAAILKTREVQEPALHNVLQIMHRDCRLGGLFE